MATGTITTLRADKGFGFIRDSPGARGNNDIFFHRSAVVGVSFDDLQEGQEVTFEPGPDPKDPSRFRANNVTPVGMSSGGPSDYELADQ